MFCLPHKLKCFPKKKFAPNLNLPIFNAHKNISRMHNVLRKMAVRHCPLTKSTSTIISSSFKINKSMLSSTRRSSSIYSNNNNFRESSNIFESIGSAGGRRRNYSGFTNASFSYTASPHPPNSISRSSSPALSNPDFQAQNPS